MIHTWRLKKRTMKFLLWCILQPEQLTPVPHWHVMKVSRIPGSNHTHTHAGPTPKRSPAWTLAHSPVLKQDLLESGVVAEAVEGGGSAADYSV